MLGGGGEFAMKREREREREREICQKGCFWKATLWLLSDSVN